jgi:uncharacterized protein (DUF4213/DUF364 family)
VRPPEQTSNPSVAARIVTRLLEAARGCREVVLLGASTPLLAQVFDGLKVTMLSGVVVKEPGEVLRVVSEGGGMQQFGPHVRKVTVRVTTLDPFSARFST